MKCSVDGRIVSINMCNRDLDEVSETYIAIESKTPNNRLRPYYRV